MKIIKFLAVTLALIAVIVTLGCSGGKDPRHVTDTFSSDTGDPFEALPHETKNSADKISANIFFMDQSSSSNNSISL